MATFKVGDRARVVRPLDACNFGKEVTIVSFETFLKGSKPFPTFGVVREDCDCIVMTDYGQRATHTSRLEPIQPERNQTIPWSECLWQPNRTEETA